MSIAVIGGTGRVGSEVVRGLLEAHAPTVLVTIKSSPVDPHPSEPGAAYGFHQVLNVRVRCRPGPR